MRVLCWIALFAIALRLVIYPKLHIIHHQKVQLPNFLLAQILLTCAVLARMFNFKELQILLLPHYQVNWSMLHVVNGVVIFTILLTCWETLCFLIWDRN